MQDEIWKEIKDFPNYEVSNLGNIRNKITLKVRKSHINQGYVWMLLYKEGDRPKGRAVHRLVAQAFIENPENKAEVNHKNLDKTDNRAENLEWCTRQENLAHARTYLPQMRPENLSLANRGEGHPQSKLTEEAVKAIFRNYPSKTQKQIADAFGISPNTVQRLLSGNGWGHLQRLNPHKKIKHDL